MGYYSITAPRRPSTSVPVLSPISNNAWPQTPPPQRSATAVRRVDTNHNIQDATSIDSAPSARATNPLKPQYDWPCGYNPRNRPPHPISMSEPGEWRHTSPVRTRALDISDVEGTSATPQTHTRNVSPSCVFSVIRFCTLSQGAFSSSTAPCTCGCGCTNSRFEPSITQRWCNAV